jgi:Phosphotransferase enzyme family
VPVDLWGSVDFVEQATAWVREAAGREGLDLTGRWEQPHLRVWSSTIRYETTAGALWFKVNGPGTRFEPAVMSVLAHRAPELVPPVMAVDLARGWSLMHDAGPVMRSVAEPDALWDRWCDLLPRYAEAQLSLGDHVDELVEAGLERLPPELMPARLAGLVEELARTPEDRGGVSAADAGRLEAALPAYSAWCAELAGSGVPASLNHDDLHSSNVCVSDAGARVIDWGDAKVSHPFATMLATLNSVSWHARTTLDDPRVLRLRDAYLEPFEGYAGGEQLHRLVHLARRTGCLGRALSYVYALEGEPLTAHEELEWPVRGWLLELLDDAWDS